MLNMKTIGIDMDETIFDFRGSIYSIVAQKGIHPFRNDAVRTVDCFVPQHRDVIKQIYHTRGFYASLIPYPGAISTIQKLQQKYEVIIVSAPSYSNQTCCSEKHQSIATYFGEEFADKNLVLTKDKGHANCDYLIDDRIQKSETTPRWKQIVFAQFWNSDTHLPRATWQTLERVLENEITRSH